MADFKKRICAQSCTIEQNGFNAFYFPGKVAYDMAIISVGGA